MAYDDLFRLSSHAVITGQNNCVLLLRANYGKFTWGLPGGALDAGETIHDALFRECWEELACLVDAQYLGGVYYHSVYNSQAFIFRCSLQSDSAIVLSEEHSEFAYVPLSGMSAVQQQRVSDCLNYAGATASAKF